MNIQKSAQIYDWIFRCWHSHAELNLFSYLSIRYPGHISPLPSIPAHIQLQCIHLYSAESGFNPFASSQKRPIQTGSIVHYRRSSAVPRTLLLSNGAWHFHRKPIFHLANNKWSIKKRQTPAITLYLITMDVARLVMAGNTEKERNQWNAINLRAHTFQGLRQLRVNDEVAFGPLFVQPPV